MSVQPRDEPTGGQYSWRYAMLPGFLDSKPPTLRELMRNAIEWDDAHPLSLAQQAARARRGRRIRSETASPRE